MKLPTSKEVHYARQFLKLNGLVVGEASILKVLLIAEIRESNRLAKKNEGNSSVGDGGDSDGELDGGWRPKGFNPLDIIG